MLFKETILLIQKILTFSSNIYYTEKFFNLIKFCAINAQKIMPSIQNNYNISLMHSSQTSQVKKSGKFYFNF